MIPKIIRRDFKRMKLINISLFLFILIPALLTVNAASMILTLSGAMDQFFQKAAVPHHVQMHAGDFDADALTEWSRNQGLVEKFQIVEMLTIDGSEVYLQDADASEADSVMDLSFVRQNDDFDLLPDLENNVFHPLPGRIGVPVYHREKYGLKLGDEIRIGSTEDGETFIIDAFVRDAMMNPSLIHSKRFVVNPLDYERLRESYGSREYLFEYLLRDLDSLEDFGRAYTDADLPATGPSINYELFGLANAVSDGITITVLILISLLFCLVAILCLRFTLLASLEEEYREIGVMKGIGIPPGFIRRIYLGKYALLGGGASFLGYVLSSLLESNLSSGILLYMGTPPETGAGRLIPLTGAVLIFLIVCLSCMVILRRFNRISAVEALRAGRQSGSPGGRKFLSLPSFSQWPMNIVMPLRDVFLRFRLFAILGIVFFLAAFIILVPLNFLNTIGDPSFVTYMGIGQSDLRIDLRQSGNMEERFDSLIARMASDPDIQVFSALKTSGYKVENQEGKFVGISVETGDFSIFPQEYLEGRYPEQKGEIALSLLNARDLDVVPGDVLRISAGGELLDMTLCGIYQDVTGGGYSAKARSLPEGEKVLWYVVSADLKDQSREKTALKIKEYSRLFYPARVTDTEEYLSQTLGETGRQLGKITILSIAAALLAVILITSLFLRMILAKDTPQNAILRGIGFSEDDLRLQYFIRILILLVIGALCGSMAANTAGEGLISAIWAMMGASRIRFVINPLQAYVLFPLTQAVLVLCAAWLVMTRTEQYSISVMNAE